MLGFLKRRMFLVVLGLLLVALVIWVGGPVVAVAGRYPLDPPLNRIIAILAVVAVWALMAWMKRRKASRAGDQLAAAVVKQSQADPMPSGDVAALRERFEEAVTALKQRRKGRHSLYDMPWYLIIGAPGSGKTTALVNSGLHFPLEQRTGKGALRGVGGTRNCDWWFTDEAVFLDTAGRYTTQDSDAAADSAGWAEFLALLRKYRKRRPVNGVLVAISAHDLLTQGAPGREAHVAATRRRLNELNKELHIQLPVYVLVTKCDLVAGFTEYFDDVVQEGRTQVWGVTFPYEQTHKGTAAASFPAEFDALVTRLNERVFQRLEEERDVRRRARLFGFPQQMAALREALSGFVSEVFSSTRFDQKTLLRGVYFTSGTQEGTPIDRLLGALGRRFAVAPEAVAPGRGKAYFIERLLKEVVLEESGLAGVNRRLEVQKAAAQVGLYAAMIALAILGLIALSYSYRQNRTYIDKVSSDVATLRQTTVPAGATLEMLLPRLDATRAVVDSANLSDVPWSMRWGLYQGGSLGDAARDAYSRQLNAALLPQVRDRFAQRLRQTSEPVAVYYYLKAYLMLGMPEHFDRDHFRELADFEWQEAYRNDPETGTRLSQHFSRLLEYNESLGPIQLDNDLVAEARRLIPAESIPQLIFAGMKLLYAADTASAVNLNVGGASQVFQLKGGASLAKPMSSLYSKAVFNKIVGQGAPELEKQFAADRWVWGDALPPSPMESSQLRAAVFDAYERDYIRAWDEVTTGLGLAPLGDLDQTRRALRTIGAAASPLREILKLVVLNTKLVEIQAQAAPTGIGSQLGQILTQGLDRGKQAVGLATAVPGAQVTTHFAPIHEFMKGEPDQAPIDAVLRDVKDVEKSMEPLGTGVGQQVSDQAQADVARAAENLKQPRPGAPASIQSLLADLGNAVQRASRAGVGAQKTNRYDRDVVNECSAAITGRYPFSPSGAEDVLLGDFGRLFGYNGVFDSFFKTELEPFVNTSGATWSIRPDASGQASIPLSTGVLAQFQAADRIRRMFFALGSSDVKLSFQLTVTDLDRVSTRFKMEIDGQPITYQYEAPRPVPIEWPGPKPGVAAVTFEQRTGPAPNTAFEGPWAWFKLFESAGRDAVSSDTYRLRFTKGSNYAEVLLNAGSVRNPFGSLNTLRQFRCRP